MRLVLACLALLAAFASKAEVYHWVDGKGAVNISSKPPASRTVDATAIGQRTWSTAPADGSISPSAATKAPVTMYMATWCGYCKKAKALLTARGIAYREVNIESSRAANREFHNLGGNGVPLILVGNERVSGYTRESLEALLHRGGY